MEEWKKLEFHYARRLRESNSVERRCLYNEAYSVVSNMAIQSFKSDNPEDRTAGTSKQLVQLLSQMVDKNDRVLEIGCGRGYTCLKLAPYVMSMVGTDVSEPSTIEARTTLSQHQIRNVDIKQVSTFEITDYFNKNEFNMCISIDVVEHLHPDDAKEHLKQVFSVLKPGGRYIVIMPNRLSGPHDITREEYPEATEALGFHLNERTYKEITDIMGEIGFNKFRIFYPSSIKSNRIKLHKKGKRPLVLPYQIGLLSEILYRYIAKLVNHNILKYLISIRLIASKPITNSCSLNRPLKS